MTHLREAGSATVGGDGALRLHSLDPGPLAELDAPGTEVRRGRRTRRTP